MRTKQLLTALLAAFMFLPKASAQSEEMIQYNGVQYQITSEGAYVAQASPCTVTGVDNEWIVPDEVRASDGTYVPVLGIRQFNLERNTSSSFTIILGKNTKYVGRLSNSTTELECNIYVYVNADNVEFNTSLCLPNVSDGVLSVSEYNIFYYGSTLGPCQFYTDVLDTKYVKPYICAPFGSNAFYVANTYSPSVFRNVTYFNYFDVNVNSLGGGTVVFNQLGTDGIIPESGGSVQLKYSSLMRDESSAYGYAFHSPGVFPYIERVDKNGSWRSEIKSYENQGDTQIRTRFLLKPSFDNTTYNIRFIPEETNVNLNIAGEGQVTVVYYGNLSGNSQTNRTFDAPGSYTIDYHYRPRAYVGTDFKDNVLLRFRLRYDRATTHPVVTYVGSGGNSHQLSVIEDGESDVVYIPYIGEENPTIDIQFRPLQRHFTVISTPGALSVQVGGVVMDPANGGTKTGVWNGSDFSGKIQYQSNLYTAEVKLDGVEVPLTQTGEFTYTFDTPPGRDNAVYEINFEPIRCNYQVYNLGNGTVNVQSLVGTEKKYYTIGSYEHANVEANKGGYFVTFSAVPESGTAKAFYTVNGNTTQGVPNMVVDGANRINCFQLVTPEKGETVPVYVDYRNLGMRMFGNMANAATFNIILNNGTRQTLNFPVGQWNTFDIDVATVASATLTVKTGNGLHVYKNGNDISSQSNPSPDQKTLTFNINPLFLCSEWIVTYLATDLDALQDINVTFGVNKGGSMTAYCRNATGYTVQTVNVEQQPNKVSTIKVNGYDHVMLYMLPDYNYKISKLMVGEVDVTDKLTPINLGSEIAYTYTLRGLYNTAVTLMYEPKDESENDDISYVVNWAGNGGVSAGYMTFLAQDAWTNEYVYTKEPYLKDYMTNASTVGRTQTVHYSRSDEHHVQNKLFLTPFEEGTPISFYINGGNRTNDILNKLDRDLNGRLCYYVDLDSLFQTRSTAQFTVMFAPDSKTTAVNHGDSIRVQALVTTGEQVVTGLQCRYNTDATGAYDIKALQTGINEFYIPNVAASANDGIAFTLPSIEGYSVKVYFNDTDVSSLIRPDADAWQLQCNGSDYRNGNSMWSIVYEKDEPAVSKGITWTGFVVGDVENGCFANVMPNGDSNLMLGSLNNETTYAQVETNLKADDINGVIANLMVKEGVSFKAWFNGIEYTSKFVPTSGNYYMLSEWADVAPFRTDGQWVFLFSKAGNNHDVNGDGAVTIADVTKLVNIILGKE